MNKKIFAAAVIMILLASCGTFKDQGVRGTPDEKAIAKGVAAWNDKAPAAATPYWNTVKDKALREKYTGYVDGFDSGEKSLADAAAAKRGDEARILASYEKGRKVLAGLPKELTLPDDTRASGNALAEGRMRSLIAAGKLSYARKLGRDAVETFGGTDQITSMDAEIDAILGSRKREAEADVVLQKARETEDFDEKVDAFDAARGAYARAETILADEAGRAGISGNQGVVRETSRLRKKRQDAAIEREKLLRGKAYSFKDSIGEEFARVPEKDKVGNMSLEELLAHQQSVKANIEAVYVEMTRFAARYPQSIDAEIIKETEEQKNDLDAKIAQINAEIRTAKEIASRGKVVMPVMIGLFNPQPGKTAEAKKSRPAVFQAKRAAKSEYWWGMVSIPRGEMNDIVVTVKDGRPVRVFSDNTKSGALIKKNKIKDLVNRGYKVGNSWPVLNAGGQLSTDKYFFEIGRGKTPDYEGDVVVYSSFIMRMR
jgi:predicted HicB family RNase H-like nuclease